MTAPIPDPPHPATAAPELLGAEAPLAASSESGPSESGLPATDSPLVDPPATDNQRVASDPEYVIRTGAMRTLAVMTARDQYRYGDRVVVRTDRGTELGVVLCEATPAAAQQLDEPLGGKIVRPMSADDEAQWTAQQDKSDVDLQLCRQRVKQLGLAMEVIDVERLLGDERVIFYFIAENRVDFRGLVRELAREIKSRIELRQVGVRDEAKLLADFGDCGKPICCATHLSKMPPVSMRMAKLQKSTLDPSKISGRCGRLKCCLRYEYDTYEEWHRQLPAVGSRIVTADGTATVLAQELMAQQLLVQTADDRRILIAADQVLSVTRRGGKSPGRSEAD
jgi:cell fate regulator YaaT (PSP1 superfamily)